MRGGAVQCAAAWVGLALLACAARGPEWLDGSADAYPPERYLIGVGSGPGVDAARDRARAEIARSLEVHIEDEVLDRTESRSDPEGRGAGRSVIERVAIETRTTTEAELEGVRIAEIWTDPRTQQAWALAVLDRESTARALLHEMAERDAEVEAHLAAARAEVESLARVRELVRAVRASQARDGLATRARVVAGGPDAPGDRQ